MPDLNENEARSRRWSHKTATINCPVLRWRQWPGVASSRAWDLRS